MPKNYIKKIREKLGHDSFIHPAARIIIENEKNEILFIQKAANGNLGIPAGAFEENESIIDCIKREVLEETGLSITNPQVIGIKSNPQTEKVKYPNGDQIQYFTVEFYTTDFSGELKTNDPDEIKSVHFLAFDQFHQLPDNEKSTFESLDYFRKNGNILVS